VCIWIATNHAVAASARVLTLNGDAVGEGKAESVRLGTNMFVHLIRVEPRAARFPTDELLSYDLALDAGVEREPHGFNVSDAGRALAYPSFNLPTFFIRESIPALNLLHGSCRLLHGKGEDAIIAADDLMSQTAGDLSRRPSALILTGDQVYADEVAGPLMGHLRALASEVIGPGDATSVPGVGRLSDFGVYGRAAVASENAKFTSGHADNHLMSLGEWVAMYLLAWNESNWPATLPAAEEAVPDGFGSRATVLKLRSRYNVEVRNLERARAAIPRLRRLFANIPTYMIFDDHDVTDDWNLNLDWRDAVYGNPTGRRAVANALASYWAFQGWGNHPDAFPPDFKAMVETHASAGDSERTDSALWSFDRWSYHIPCDTPIVVVDTRTQRDYDSGEGAARLVGASERRRIVELARAAGHRPGGPLIIVSAVPVFGLELQERRQKFLVGKLGPYEIDFEAWHSNLQGLVDFLHLLIDDLELHTCLILSGDVHYGLNARARFSIRDNELTILQLVSSSLKHSGAMSKSALNLLGRLVSKKHERVGWDRPPAVASDNRLVERVLSKSTNTDEWNADAPVFLGPKRAEVLGITQPPDYLECRIYVRPEGAGSLLVGENNIGLVTVDRDEIVHRLMALGAETTEHIARIEARDGLAELAPQEW
jgi:hypothetical protein